MQQKNIFLVFLLVSGCAASPPDKGLLGAYQLTDGRIVSISRSSGDSLRYRLFKSGATGRLYKDTDKVFVSGKGFSNREPVNLTVTFDTSQQGLTQSLQWITTGETPLSARRIGKERTVWFESDGAKLHGRLQLPDSPPPFPAVVLVHGSGDSPGTEWYFDSDFFVANGIAALTYDKRGSGRSEGSFTFDYEQLARDAIAAANSIVNDVEVDPGRVGLSGYSQGAWVAPLAASKSDVIQFVIVNFGMIESPAEEARMEMRQLLIDADVSAEELRDADALIRAAIELVAHEFKSDWKTFERLKQQHENAAWTKYLDDTPIGIMLKFPKFLVRLLGPSQLPEGLNWYYDSVDVLSKSDKPMAWLLGEKDISAPNAQTINKLKAYAEAGKPYTLYVFPDADHSMLLFDVQKGKRIYTSYAPGYFQAEVDAVWQIVNQLE